MENLPSEIQWNIMKFMKHPVADMFTVASADITYLDDDGYCMHGFSFAFNWFNEAMYEKQETIRDMNIDKELKRQLMRGIKRHWDLYIRR